MLALLVWLTITAAVPFAAQRVAFMLPASATESLGEDTLRQMDQTYFEPSRLPHHRRQALLRRSQAFLDQVDETSVGRIEFRHAPSIGANALAFPSGTIVFTDDLVRLSSNDEQLLAVLAHEAGHVHHRHGLRGMLQSSAVTLALTLLVGEERSASALQSALAANLINSRYSREFEYEADAHAKLLLARANIPASRLGEILDLMENEHGHDGGESYLDSHPSTPDRKRRLNEN